jgi:purine-nucleoside phosphorylase
MNYPAWSDLNNSSVVPPLGARHAPDIGPVAVMASCEPDFKLIRSCHAVSKTGAFFTSTLITLQPPHEGICVTGPFLGAPYAVMLLESLIARGADKIIFIGWCGATSDRLSVGDIIVPVNAIVDEGTSCNYKMLDAGLPVSSPHKGFSRKLSDHLRSSAGAVKEETIWTTDAIYRETRKKIDYFCSLGAQAVEMECSALFSVAEYRKVQLASVLIVSDSVASKDWTPGFRKKQFKSARKNACASVMEFARKMCSNE